MAEGTVGAGTLGPEPLAGQQERLTPEQITRLRATGALDAQWAFTPFLLLMLFPPSDVDAIEHWLTAQPGMLGVALSVGFYGLAFLGLAAFFAYLIALMRRWRRFSREAKQGIVAQANGALAWHGRRYFAEAGGAKLRGLNAASPARLPGPYRFTFLPTSRVVVTAEWIGAPVPYAAWLKRSPFLVSALPFNRQGRRSPDQTGARGSWLSGIAFGLIVGVSAASLFTRGTADLVLYSAQLFSFVLFIFVLSDPRRFTDMRPGRVASVAGVVRRERRQRQNGVWDYTFTVDDLRLTVSQATYDALDARYIYRLYYTVRGSHLLNMEPIATVADTRQGAP